MVKDFNAAVSVSPVEGLHPCSQWMHPPRGCVKVNVDAAFCNTTRIATLGVVARNEKSEVCYSAVTKSAKTDTPLLAKIKAILFGVQLAKEMNIQKIQLESDCLMAIKEITKKQQSFCEWSSLLFDILDLSTEFESW
ncbi:hypothetical protein CRYUN_Cryun06bG0111000 [Craigia yunnanensis]